MTDRTQLFFTWIEDIDFVTASELLAFADYAQMTVAEAIARLREENVEVIPDSGGEL